MIAKPLVTISGKKILLKNDLRNRISQDLPQEGVEWHRRLDSNSRTVYIDIDFVDFDVDNVERSSEKLTRLIRDIHVDDDQEDEKLDSSMVDDDDQENPSKDINSSQQEKSNSPEPNQVEPLQDEVLTSTNKSVSMHQQQKDISQAFYQDQKLLGRPILHTYWADKTDIESEDLKSHFDEWIGQVQASTCTEWAIIIIEDNEFKAHVGTALFKSKLQSSISQANLSSASITSQVSTTSFLDRAKKGLSSMFQKDTDSDRWLTLMNQERRNDTKVQESYTNFIKKFKNIIMASFSKQIELFEEKLRVQREVRNDKSWNFFSFFSMQEELAFAFEFLTLFDEALVQYDLLDALLTEYISSAAFESQDKQQYEQWTSFNQWAGLCLDTNSEYSVELRSRIVDRKASLLDLRNYLFAKQCDLILLQNQPWKVAASTNLFLINCMREHKFLNVNIIPGALTCWSFISALEVLQKCECYSCTSTMENYSRHTVDIWNFSRLKLIEIGRLTNLLPSNNNNDHTSKSDNKEYIDQLLRGLGPDPHNGTSFQHNEISPQARLRDALTSQERFLKHLIEISELTLGTYKHIGRKRHALLVGKELADFYIAQNNHSRALPFLVEFQRALKLEGWSPLLLDVQSLIEHCRDRIEPASKAMEVEEIEV